MLAIGRIQRLESGQKVCRFGRWIDIRRWWGSWVSKTKSARLDCWIKLKKEHVLPPVDIPIVYSFALCNVDTYCAVFRSQWMPKTITDGKCHEAMRKQVGKMGRRISFSVRRTSTNKHRCQWRLFLLKIGWEGFIFFIWKYSQTVIIRACCLKSLTKKTYQQWTNAYARTEENNTSATRSMNHPNPMEHQRR